MEVVHGQVRGAPPVLDLEKEKKVQEAVLTAIEQGLLQSAHDCSDGGLAVALAECCISGPGPHLGADLSLEDPIRSDALLFGESQSRIIVSVEDKDLDAFKEILNRLGAPVTFLGLVGGDRLTITLPENGIDCEVETLRKIYSESLRSRMVPGAIE
jgi:phosphoribosylformylglycinamidine (FGAM) synthase-like enzyme